MNISVKNKKNKQVNPRESYPEHYSKIKNLSIESKKLRREEKLPIGLEKYKQKPRSFLLTSNINKSLCSYETTAIYQTFIK